MIRHSLTLEHIAKALRRHLVGAQLVECWTQEKHTLDLTFLPPTLGSKPITKLTHSLHVDLDPIVGSIQHRTETHRARKNTVDLFPTLLRQTCTDVKTITGDRVLTLSFATGNLHILMYSGGKANVVVEKSGSVTDAFQDKKQYVGQSFLPKPAPTVLGKYYSTLDGTDEEIIRDCRTASSYYVLTNGSEVLFSLLPLDGWDVQTTTPDVFEALRIAVAKRRYTRRYKELHDRIERMLLRERTKFAKAISAMENEALVSSRAAEHRHNAELLMSQPGPMQTGRTSIDVQDWDGVPRTIELDNTMTLIENAQRFYDKARRSDASAKERSSRLPLTKKRLEDVDRRIELLKNITDISELEAMAKTAPNSPGQEPATRYREFDLGDGYTLYVGRNAANNDELTMKFAKQNDLWLHARGNSGSHAVLRNASGETKTPKKILEQAAAITAWYSGARNASWTPVVYTLRKNVRKPKGANVGAVVLEREDVIMVKPSLPIA